ncbi:MAG: FAD-dependent monooxygenase [Clostridia bacterium]|nr:FAD-dependent monooxygenase [Clostridia bacterium]
MISTTVFVTLGYTDEDIRAAVINVYPIAREEILDITVIKRTLVVDERVGYKMTVGITLSPEREAGLLKMPKKFSPVTLSPLEIKKARFDTRPIIVGAGPCGIFAALMLAEAGARPILLERGEAVDDRIKTVARFNITGELSPESNAQFGEGGAGTFSDGKLKVGSRDKYKMKVLDTFVSAGAPEEIFYSSTAHLGTDKLPNIIKKIRERIVSLGGEVIFSARVVDLVFKCGTLASVIYEKDGDRVELGATDVIFATGHSARDTVSMLYSKGAPMVSRGFGIGMRVEHPREYINSLVYGKGYDPRLETAGYHLVTHLPTGRSVYSFCMCPGGTVVAATSDLCGTVTNGMSVYERNGDNSNSALLVSVTPADFPSDCPLSGFELQARIERAAYSLTGSHVAPAIRMADLLESSASLSYGSVTPSYPRGTELHTPERYLPEYVTSSLKSALLDFDDWMHGFIYPDAILTGPETRTTSPVRILRDERSFECIGLRGVFVAGEGAGYAGGIISSATDGVRCAEALINKYSV